MWFRWALLLMFWLLVYRLVSGVLRRLSGPPPRNDAREPRSGAAGKGNGGRAASTPPAFSPDDVIDVPFREAPREEPSRSDERAS